MVAGLTIGALGPTARVDGWPWLGALVAGYVQVIRNTPLLSLGVRLDTMTSAFSYLDTLPTPLAKVVCPISFGFWLFIQKTAIAGMDRLRIDPGPTHHVNDHSNGRTDNANCAPQRYRSGAVQRRRDLSDACRGRTRHDAYPRRYSEFAARLQNPHSLASLSRDNHGIGGQW